MTDGSRAGQEGRPSGTVEASPANAGAARADPGEGPTIVVVGAAARDVARDDPRGWRLGGGVAYSALTTARLGVPTAALVGVDGPGATAAELDLLRNAGVDVRLVELERGPVFDNVETPEGRIQIGHVRADPIPVNALPAAWRGAPAWILAAVADELPPAWAEVPGDAALVAAGWQGLLREVVAGQRVRRLPPGESPIVARADLVGVSRDDLGPAAAVDDLLRFLRPGATLVLTQGDHGGLVMTAGPDGASAMYHYPAIRSPAIVDPTGAGDVFLAALLAARAEPRLVGGRLDKRFDVLLAAAVASLVLEGQGLLGVPHRSAVRRRMSAARQAV
jgi:sugar/nucleoside kinase (ribokinase family)